MSKRAPLTPMYVFVSSFQYPQFFSDL